MTKKQKLRDVEIRMKPSFGANEFGKSIKADRKARYMSDRRLGLDAESEARLAVTGVTLVAGIVDVVALPRVRQAEDASESEATTIRAVSEEIAGTRPSFASGSIPYHGARDLKMCAPLLHVL
jgi:hypothetical protein